jgi:hypothetical protein
MPFDGLPEGLVADVVKLRVALDGVRRGWCTQCLGLEGEEGHCAVGWLLKATDYDTTETTRLALEYVYPALPATAQTHNVPRLESIYEYNDGGGQKRIERLFETAIKLADAKLKADAA